MGALVRLWFREHRLFLAGSVLVALAVTVTLPVMPWHPMTWQGWCAVWALMLTAMVVLGCLSDTERGAK